MADVRMNGRRTSDENGRAIQPCKPGSSTAQQAGLHVADLLRHRHAAFVENGFELILGRNADAESFRRALDYLGNGGAPIRFLGDLRYSAEGRARGVNVRGLWWRYAVERLFHIPLLGYVIEMAVSIVRLPLLVRRTRVLEVGASADAAATRERMDRLLAEWQEYETRRWNTEQERVHTSLDALAAAGEQRHAQLNAAIAGVREALTQRDEAYNHLERELAGHAVEREALSTRLQQINTELAERMRALAGELQAMREATQADRRRSRELDTFYAAFEDAFRGTREDIKARVAVYLPTLARAGAGTLQRPVVDIGSGRGEWLEVLREHDLAARGVDANAVLVAQSRERGLHVEESDMLDYLRTLPTESVGAVTGLHIVEHLPFLDLIELIDECVRVLQPGGVLVFETPNPSNILVASNTFYLDPTHRNPIPSALLKFLLESRGLPNVDLKDLHPSPHQWSALESELDRYLVANLFGAQDYAAIGFKPGAAAAPTA